MLAWSLNISIIFIVNSKIALVFEIELRMNNHCGESVGFLFRAALWFRSDFVYAKFPETNVMLSFYLLAIFTVKSNDSVSFSCFLVFFVKDQIASFQLKEFVVFLN